MVTMMVAVVARDGVEHGSDLIRVIRSVKAANRDGGCAMGDGGNNPETLALVRVES